MGTVLIPAGRVTGVTGTASASALAPAMRTVADALPESHTAAASGAAIPLDPEPDLLPWPCRE